MNNTTHPKIEQIINILTSTPCPNLLFLAAMDFVETFSIIEIAWCGLMQTSSSVGFFISTKPGPKALTDEQCSGFLIYKAKGFIIIRSRNPTAVSCISWYSSCTRHSYIPTLVVSTVIQRLIISSTIGHLSCSSSSPPPRLSWLSSVSIVGWSSSASSVISRLLDAVALCPYPQCFHCRVASRPRENI